MEREPKDEIMDDEMMEEMAEDMGIPRREDGDDGPGTILDLKHWGWPIVFAGLGVVALIVILTLVFGGGKEASMEDLKALRARVDQIESRLGRLEGIAKDASSVESKIRGLEQSISKLDRAGSSLKQGLETVAQRLEGVQKEAASRPVQQEVKKETTPLRQVQQDLKETAPKAEKRFHTVRRGDTLFGIAKKYGLSIEELRRINHFKKDQEITPDQRILVTP